MSWDSKTHPLITRTRLRLATPERVFDELEEYGGWLRGRRYLGGHNEPMERELAARGDKLVDLGLAKNASTTDVVAKLYMRARAGTGDASYDKGLRLAALANEVTAGLLFVSDRDAIDKSEFRRLAFEGDDDEVEVFMRNRTRRYVLRDVFGRKSPVEDLPDDRWLLLVRAGVGNEALNDDESSEHGPDFMTMDVHRGIVNLLEMAPLQPRWLQTLFDLLMRVDPHAARSLNDEGQARALMERWKSVKVDGYARAGSPVEEQTGYYTQQTLTVEFCCLVAALYGRVFTDKKFVVVGSPDADDVVLRCAHYGRAKMALEEMQTAHARDDATFVFAALMNDNILLDKKLRLAFEEMLTADLSHHYAKRCAQLHKHWRWFDPEPVSETWVPEAEPGDAPKPAEEATVLALTTATAATGKQIERLSSILQWGLIILGVMILYFRP